MREVNIQSSILVPIFFALHEQYAHKHQDNCCFGQPNCQTQLKMDPHNEQVLSLLFMALVKHLMGMTQALILLLGGVQCFNSIIPAAMRSLGP